MIIASLARFLSSSAARPLCDASRHLCSTSVVRSQRYLKRNDDTTVLEFIPGAGGREASIFADELFNVYRIYLTAKGWPFEVLESQESAKIAITTPDSYKNLAHEAGVHRIKRIPTTERQGRIHTSTIAVTVTPLHVLEFKLEERDITVQTVRSQGAGGQNVNKRETRVRIIHEPTGITVEAQEHRHQAANMKVARERLLQKIKEAELSKLSGQVEALRKSQLGNIDRSERSRTYEVNRDQVIEHNLNKIYHQCCRKTLAGDPELLIKIHADYMSSS